MAHHYNIATSRLIVISHKAAARAGMNAQQGEKISRNLRPCNRLWLPHTFQVEAAESDGCHLLEYMVLATPVEIICRRNYESRNAWETLLRRSMPDHREAPRVRKWKRAQHNSIDRTENRGDDPDSERQCEHSNSREAFAPT